MSAQVGAQTSPTTTFDAWVASKGDAVGPPGTTSVLTPLAARELWDREAQGADLLDNASVERLDAVIQADIKRATAFQALLRGRVDRRKAPAATPSASRNEPSSTRCSMMSSLTSFGLRTKPEMSALV